MSRDAPLLAIEVPHLPLVAALHAEIFPTEPWSEASLAGLWASPGCFGWIASGAPAARPQGFVLARLAADEAELISLGVRAAARRQGLGAGLLAAVAEAAEAAGARALFLEVAESNGAARAFYDARGFREVGRRPDYYHTGRGGSEDAVIMELRLDT